MWSSRSSGCSWNWAMTAASRRGAHPGAADPDVRPGKVATDLVNAIGEGINNAAALVGSPPPLSIPAPVTLAAPATETAKADMSPQVTSDHGPSTSTRLGDANPASDDE